MQVFSQSIYEWDVAYVLDCDEFDTEVANDVSVAISVANVSNDDVVIFPNDDDLDVDMVDPVDGVFGDLVEDT